MSHFLTVADIAEETGFSPRTVLRWIKRGDLKAVRFPSGRLRISQTAYGEFLAHCSTAPVPRIVGSLDEGGCDADG